MRQGNLPIDHGDLYKQLSLVSYLKQGFRLVKKNKGVPGVDGVSIETFEANIDAELSHLSAELEGWTYKPKPVLRVEIPKPGKHAGVRLLGIPTVRDRTVQATLKMLLEPILDPAFSEQSYGFRPKRNQRQAIESIQQIVRSGKSWVVDIDLSKFFDRVNHDRLIQRLGKQIHNKAILRLVGMMLRGGVNIGDIVEATTEGTVQGSPISPLLSNVVLDELDKELERRGLEFCRYADDCQIYVGSLKSAKRVMGSISTFIEKKLKLFVNWDKSKVAKIHQVKFLGMSIVDEKVVISKQSMKRAMEKIKMLTPRGTYQKFERTIASVNRWYRGWSSYYIMTQYPSQFRTLEAHIRRRLRSRFISQQKRRRHLFSKLIKRGVARKLACNVYSNKGRWALSRSIMMSKALSNSWFVKNGLFLRSEEDHPHWLGVKQWPKIL